MDWHLQNEVFAVGTKGTVWRLKRSFRNKYGHKFIECPPTRADRYKSSNGYRRVMLTKSGVRCTVMAHSLIFELLTGESIPDGYVIHHKNGNRDDNRLSNLQMVSWDFNNDMMYWLRLWPSDGIRPDAVEDSVYWIKAAATTGQSVREIAQRFGLRPGVVSAILSGEICPHITLEDR